MQRKLLVGILSVTAIVGTVLGPGYHLFATSRGETFDAAIVFGRPAEADGDRDLDGPSMRMGPAGAGCARWQSPWLLAVDPAHSAYVVEAELTLRRTLEQTRAGVGVRVIREGRTLAADDVCTETGPAGPVSVRRRFGPFAVSEAGRLEIESEVEGERLHRVETFRLLIHRDVGQVEPAVIVVGWSLLGLAGAGAMARRRFGAGGPVSNPGRRSSSSRFPPR